MAEPVLSDVVSRLDEHDKRLGKLERRVASIDQRLERVEGKQDAMQTSLTSILAWQQAHSERVDALTARMDSRFDCLEKLIRDSIIGHGS